MNRYLFMRIGSPVDDVMCAECPQGTIESPSHILFIKNEDLGEAKTIRVFIGQQAD